MKQSGIYRIVCSITGKFYIGSAVDLRARWSVHQHLLRRGKHNSIHLQRAWDKYGASAFRFEVIEYVDDRNSLIDCEQRHLDYVKPFGEVGYNISPRAGHTLGTKRTPEFCERQSERLIGKKLTEEHKAAIGAAGRGRKHSRETIEKMRQARLKNNHQVGRPLTEAQKKAIGKKGTEHPWFGRSHSDESKRKISEATSKPVEQVDVNGVAIRSWPSSSEAAKELGLRGADTIRRAVVDRRKKAAGYYWRHVQDRAVVS